MTATEPLPSISAPETDIKLPLLPAINLLLRRLWQYHRPVILILATSFLLSIATILYLRPWLNFTPPQPLPTLPPTPVPTSMPVSPFATDSAILELKLKLKDLSSQIDQTDMDETDLLPPSLDLNVSFE